MKRLLSVLCLIFCIALLCGCENGTEEEAATNEAAVTETEATVPEEEAAPQEAPFSVDEMNQIYAEATAAWDLFDMTPLDVVTEHNDDGTMKFYTFNGIDGYQKTNDGKYQTLADLKSAVEAYFSADIVSELLDDERYFEADGVLYELSAGRGSDITVGEILRRDITEFTADSLTYVITTEEIDPESDTVCGEKEFTFTYAKIGDGWVFTKYQPIY